MMTVGASYDIITMVKVKIMGNGSNGYTHKVELSISHRFHTKVQREGSVQKVRQDMMKILWTLYNYKRVEIISGAVCSDHIHICASIPPKISVSEFVGYLKEQSAWMIHDKHPEFENKWNREFWERGYYGTTIDNITAEQSKKYIAEQEEETKREDIRI